jgi:antitoxin (DNA-binding transcriptional repressor) of toxin-antitoxin stability system
MTGPNEDEALQKIGIREFRTRMADILRQARLGAAFLITSHDEVVAELWPPSPALRPRRRPGALRGKIRMAADFDSLPQDVLEAMESGPG